MAWFVGSIALAAAESLTGDFFLLMLAGGALAAAGFSALTDFPVWVDGIVFAVTSVVLLLAVRPLLLRKFRAQLELPMNVDALPGKSALVLEDVTPVAGLIKLDGEVWTARPIDVDEVYPAGAQVTVFKIDGATAVVFKEPDPG